MGKNCIQETNMLRQTVTLATAILFSIPDRTEFLIENFQIIVNNQQLNVNCTPSSSQITPRPSRGLMYFIGSSAHVCSLVLLLFSIPDRIEFLIENFQIIINSLQHNVSCTLSSSQITLRPRRGLMCFIGSSAHVCSLVLLLFSFVQHS